MNELKAYVQQHGYAHVAARMGCKYQRVQKWVLSGRIPAERAVEVEERLGIPRHKLRPDLWPESLWLPAVLADYARQGAA